MIKFLFPHRCLVCNQPLKNGLICSDCWSKLELYNNHQGKCLYCQRPAFNNLTHDKCTTKLSLSGGLVLFNYNQFISRLIRKLKYKLLAKGEEVFSELIDFWWAKGQKEIIEYWQRNDFVLQPVPLSSGRLAWRGFNQTEVLASLLSRRLGLVKSDYLTRKGISLPRLKLSLSERKKVIKGKFDLKSQLPDKARLILVDDVLTTGATLREIGYLLKRNKAAEIWYLVLAAKKCYAKTSY